jgi:3-O-alpha-D-mannopyranosyl-alpha-D-mannopyranose xylosylphosphotransferase
MGGVVYFFISNMLISDWLDVERARAISTVQGSMEWLEATSAARTAATWMGTGIVPIPEDPSHVLVPVTTETPVELLQPIKRFHAPSLVNYYVNGRLDALPSSVLPNPTVDMLYTFVNASSPILQEAMTRRRAAEGLPAKEGSSSRWRDNGELRGALRSSVHSLGEAVRKVHIISADFDLDEPSPAPEGESIEVSTKDEGYEAEYEWVETEDVPGIFSKWKIGQVPSWLDTASEQDKLAWHFHSEIYRLPMDDGVLDPRLADHWGTEAEWKAYATPTFSSFSIETRLGWVKDLGENM